MTIVNFSTKNYKAGQNRLKASLNGHKTLMLDNYAAIGSPTHQESPYEFKIHAIKAALELDDIVLWMDASMWRVGDLSEIERIIIEDGYFLTESGHYVSQWTNEFTKNHYQLTGDEMRQDSTGMLMFSAGLIGLNKNSPKAMSFLEQWHEGAKAGCFRGDWADHRHDMSVGSIIASRLKMKYQRGGQFMSYIGQGYSAPEPGSVIHLQGL